jgi:hypothetical protein
MFTSSTPQYRTFLTKQRSLNRLESSADNTPYDADAQAEYLQLLNESNNPQEVIRRYESNLYAKNSRTEIEYVKVCVVHV